MKIRLALLVALSATLLPCVSRAQSSHTLLGRAAGDNFGSSVQTAGDVDQDGFADVVVGAPFADPKGLINAGSAAVHSGLNGSLLLSFNGANMLDLFGRSVAGVGDVDGDGHADVAVSAFFSGVGGSFVGEVDLFSGATGGLIIALYGAANSDQFGNSISAAGDVNMDGFVDLVVGAWGSDLGGKDSGSATVISGKTAGVLKVLAGGAAGDSFGCAVADAGDVNGDGHDDVIVGAYLADIGGVDSGAAYVYSGKDFSQLASLAGGSAAEWLGIAVAGAGDANQDGFADVIVGTPYDDSFFTDGGTATVMSGKDAKILHVLQGLGAGDQFGGDVDGAGDADLDGHDDVLVGAQFADDNGSDSGTAYLLSGQTGAQLDTWVGDAAGDGFGSSVASAGDVDGDGTADFIFGAPKNDTAGGDAGLARVFFDCKGKVVQYGSACAGTGGFAPQLAMIGCPKVLGSVTLSIDGGLGGAVSVLMFGLGKASLPLGFGCALNISPVLPAVLVIPLGGSGPGNGSVALASTIPATVPSIVFTMQTYVIDAGAPLGAALTNGLEVTIP